MNDLTAARLRELLHYDPATGVWTWLVNVGSRARAGAVAGTPLGHGYLQIRIDPRRHYAHRLAYLYQTGAHPIGEIDHINGVRSDNRWSNLRDVSRAVNLQNQRTARPNSKAGLLGTNPRPTGRCAARIDVDGVTLYLGTFDTPEQAHAAYIDAKRKLHEGCTI